MGTTTDRETTPTPAPGDHQTCVELALELWGEPHANALTQAKARLARELAGSDGRPRWDCLHAAILKTDAEIRREGRDKPIGDVIAYLLSSAGEMIVLGVQPLPVGLKPPPKPAAPTREEKEAKAAEMTRRLKERLEREAKGV